MIETINGYSYTPLSAVESARRVFLGEASVGFETPATLFGSSYAVSIDGAQILDH